MDLLVIIKDNLLPFLVVLTVLVFVHELGHYLIARWNRVRVEVFSVGFGPELFGRTDRLGTRWRLSAIPLGGYVRMFGDADATSARSTGTDDMSDEDRAVSFHHKRLGQRTAVVFAGPAANFLFAIVLLSVLYAVVGQYQATPHVDDIVPDSAAAEAGLEIGDRIVAIDDVEIARFADLQQIVRASPGITLSLRVERGDSLITVPVTPHAVYGDADDSDTARATGLLGIRSQQTTLVHYAPLDAVHQALSETWSLTRQTLVAVAEMITGSRAADELGGPLRIAQLSAQVAELGLGSLIWFTALLSINLGLINLFPIPVLDGGHLVFYAVEAVRGRPLGQRVQEWASIAGLSVVIGLMVFVTWNDLIQMRVFEFFGSMFS